MADKNILKIRLTNTGLKSITDNLQINQNSDNNRLYLYTENKYEFVSVFYTTPDGITSYKHHMMPDGYDSEQAAYVYYDDIDKAITSFIIPTQTSTLKVSFAAYTKNISNQYSPVMVNDTNIVVVRVSNSEVLDRTYNGSDVQNLWAKLNEVTDALSILDPQDTSEVLIKLKNDIKNNYDEIMGILDTVPNTDSFYTKDEIDNKLITTYKFAGSVSTYDDLLKYKNVQIGIVYNVEDTGMNYAWTGEVWDSIGASNIDMTQYYTKDYVDNKLTLLNNRINSSNEAHKTLEQEVSSDKADISARISTLNDQIDNTYTKDEVYNKTEIDNKITGLYRYKGTVDNISDLPTSAFTGDVYDVANDNHNNYAWNGSDWDSLGPVVNLDLYYTRLDIDSKFDGILSVDNVYTKSDIDSKLSDITTTTFNLTNRVDNVEGDLATQIAATNSTINSLSNKLTSADTALSNTVESYYHILDTKIDDTSNTLTTKFTDNYNTVNSRVSTVVSRLDSAEGSLNTVDSRISTAIDSLDENISDRLVAINTNITSTNNVLETKLSNDYNTKINEVSSNLAEINTNLSNDYNSKINVLSNTVTSNKTAVDNEISKIKESLTTVYHYKGTIDKYANLPTDAEVGDTYNVEDKRNGNYAWNGTEWDSLGDIIDLTPYATTDALNSAKSTLNSKITALTSTVSTNLTDAKTYAKNYADGINTTLLATINSNATTAKDYTDTREADILVKLNTAKTTLTNSIDTVNSNLTANINSVSANLNNQVDVLTNTITTNKSDIENKLSTAVSNINTNVNLKANSSDVYTKTEADAEFLSYSETISKAESIVTPSGINVRLEADEAGTYTLTKVDDIVEALIGFTSNKYL